MSGPSVPPTARTLRTGVATACRMVLACVPVAFTVLTVIYVLPMNPIMLWARPVIEATIGTYAPQSWDLFAPNPVSANVVIAIQPLRTVRGQGFVPAAPWVDLSSGLWAETQQHPLSMAQAISKLERTAASLAMSGVGDYETGAWQYACANIDTSACPRAHEIARENREAGLTVLDRLGSAFCAAQFPHDRAITAFTLAVLVQEQSIPAGDRHTSGRYRTVLRTTLSVDRSVAPLPELRVAAWTPAP